jgi:hypothetical protein
MATNQIQAAWPLKKPQHLVYIELGPSNGGMMLGICKEGLSYRAVSPLISDGPVNFAFALDGKNRLQGVGEIAWSEDGGKTGGLKFTNVSSEFREAIRVWLASEVVPKNVGREITPAAAMPLDSFEKIKEAAREKSVAIPEPPEGQEPEETKKQFKPRDWSSPIPELRVPSQNPAETNPIEPELAATEPLEVTRIEAKPLEEKHIETASVEKASPAAASPVATEVAPKTDTPAMNQLAPSQTEGAEKRPMASDLAEVEPAALKHAAPTPIEPALPESKPASEKQL